LHKSNNIKKALNWEGKNILLIDSDWVNIRLHKVYFAPMKVNLVCARSFEEVNKLFFSTSFDLILTEINFLNLKWQKLFQYANTKLLIPIIIQTTQTYRFGELDELKFQFVNKFSKPISWIPYLEIIDGCLNTGKVKDSLEENNNKSLEKSSDFSEVEKVFK
jgi:DNA-binding NtrC family response regulator